MEMEPGSYWWVIPLLTFAGVLLAQVVILYGLFMRQRAEDQRRWHEKRVEVYLKLLAAARGAIEPLTILSHASTSTTSDQPAADMSRKKLVRRLELSAIEADEAWVSVRLLGTEPVRAAGFELWKVLQNWNVDDAIDQLLDDPRTSGEIWATFLTQATARRVEFETKIRAEVGIKSPAPTYSVEARSRFGLILAALRTIVRRQPRR